MSTPDLDVGVVGHPRQPRGVAVDRQALVLVVEVAVVEGVADREPGDDVRAQLLGVGLPLLGGVALDERLVERAADQADRLLLEVLGVRSVSISLACSAISARASSGVWVLPKNWLISAEVHRQRVDLALVLAEHPVLVAR